MSIADQLKSLEKSLGLWAASLGGVAFVAPDMRRFWNLAYQSSDTPRVIIVWYGEALRGAFSVAAALHRVDRQFLVAFTRGRGLNANRGDSLTTDIGNAIAFCTLYEQLRDLIRALTGLSVESPVDWKDAQTAQQVTDVLDGVVMRFSTAVDLPGLETMPPDGLVPVGQTCSWTVVGGLVTPDVLSSTTSYFASSIDFPAGQYRVYYDHGAMSYGGIGAWQINRFGSDGHGFVIVYSGGSQVNGPGLDTAYGTPAACVTANTGQFVEFTHTGGPIGVFLHDSPYGDNFTQPPGPTFSLQQYVCVPNPAV